MDATSKIDEYTNKAEIAIAEMPKKLPLLANYLGLGKAYGQQNLISPVDEGI